MKPNGTIFILITISWTFAASVSQATGDCSDFTDLTGFEMPISVSGTTEGASNDYYPFNENSQEPDCWEGIWSWISAMGPDLTFKWTAPVEGWYAISLVGSGINKANLLLFDFTCPEEPNYPEDFICGSQGVILDDGFVTDLWLETGQEILIVVDGYHLNSGPFNLQILDTNNLNDYLPFLMEAFNLPGLAVNVIRDGSPCWSGEFGSASLEPGNTSAVTDTTLFITMCACKPITGTMLMQAWEDGLIDLDQDANDYLDFDLFHPDYPDIPITTRMLMCNVAGINDRYLSQYIFYDEDCPVSLAEFMYDYFSPDGDSYSPDLNFTNEEPGTAYNYSTMGIALLGYLVECVGHPTTFLDHCEGEMFGPLDINRASFMLEDILVEEHLAWPYKWDENDWAVPSSGHPHVPWYPAQSLRITSSEMARFLMAIINGGELDGHQIVSTATVDSMLTIQFPDVEIPYGDGGPEGHSQGLVWKLIDLDGREAWGALGDGWNRACSAMFFSPEENNGAVFLANSGCDESTTCSGGSFIMDALLDFAARPQGACSGIQITNTPQDVQLNLCYPNPFNPNTTLSFSLDRAQGVRISIFDMAGRRIAEITDQVYGTGLHTVDWDGKDSTGRAVSSGPYLVRMETEGWVESQKIMLVR